MPVNLRNSYLDDYKIVDNVETVTLTTVRAAITTNVNVTMAAREALRSTEIAASGGLFQMGDSVFHLSVTQILVVEPLEGDKITDSISQAWHIIGGVTTDELRLNYRCVVRKDR